MKAKTALNLISLGTNIYLVMKNKETAKKAAYMAAGFAAIGKQKLENMAKEITDNTQMTQNEGKKFIDELISKSKVAREELEKKVEEISKKAFAKMNLATTEDVKRLEKKIAELSKKIKG